jgi:hypothetical protein
VRFSSKNAPLHVIRSSHECVFICACFAKNVCVSASVIGDVITYLPPPHTIKGSRFWVEGFRWSVLGFQVPGFGLRFSGLEHQGIPAVRRVSIFGVWVSVFEFRASVFGFQVSVFGFRDSVFGFRDLGVSLRVSGFGFQVSGVGIRDL